MDITDNQGVHVQRHVKTIMRIFQPIGSLRFAAGSYFECSSAFDEWRSKDCFSSTDVLSLGNGLAISYAQSTGSCERDEREPEGTGLQVALTSAHFIRLPIVTSGGENDAAGRPVVLSSSTLTRSQHSASCDPREEEI